MKLQEAIDYFGTKSEMARALGIEPQSITLWVDDDRIPILRQYHIQVVTKGKLKADKVDAR